MLKVSLIGIYTNDEARIISSMLTSSSQLLPFNKAVIFCVQFILNVA